jgi:hypothetical protein
MQKIWGASTKDRGKLISWLKTWELSHLEIHAISQLARLVFTSIGKRILFYIKKGEFKKIETHCTPVNSHENDNPPTLLRIHTPGPEEPRIAELSFRNKEVMWPSCFYTSHPRAFLHKRGGSFPTVFYTLCFRCPSRLTSWTKKSLRCLKRM